MAKYFQTDDRDDYFAQTDKEYSVKTVSVFNPKGSKIFNSVQTRFVRDYYKNNYCNIGENGKRIWREKLTELGYRIIKE